MYLTIEQAAQRLQVSKATISRKISDGSLKASKLSRKTVRILEEDLTAYVNSHQR